MKRERIISLVLLGAAAFVVWGLGTFVGDPRDRGMEVTAVESNLRTTKKAGEYNLAREIVSPAGFLNTPEDLPIQLQQYIGNKVVLLDIWTYSCINCQRTLPYLRDWYAKYKDQGLEIIGIHTPEFEFEKDIENVRAATERFDVTWPVVLDNDRGTWNAYQNQYWPRKYLIDIDGFVVYDHIGEGGYEETELLIQEALKERAEVLGEQYTLSDTIVAPADAVEVDRVNPRSPEIYFGAWRNERLVNGPRGELGRYDFVIPDDHELIESALYLVGKWEIGIEQARSGDATAQVVFPYHATNVFTVAAAAQPTKLFVRIDGEPVSEELAGSDVVFGDGAPYILVDEEKLYKIIEAPAWGEHLLELIAAEPNLDLYTFTFG